MIVPRHDIDIPAVQEFYAKQAGRVSYFLEWARKKPDNLDLLISQAMRSACSGVAVGLPWSEVKRLFRLAAQAYRALFLVVRAGDTYTVTVPLGEGDPVLYDLDVPLDVSYLDPQRWLRAFFLGAVLRDNDLLTALVNTPTDLIRRSTIKGPEYRYTLIDALRTFIEGAPQRKRARAMELVAQAIHETDPEREDVVDSDYTLWLDVPLLALTYSFMEHVDLKEHDPKFGDRLAQALERHKEYYNRDEMKRLDQEGFLSLPLLGLASLAFEYHIPFDVESDYIPGPLVRNEALESVPEARQAGPAPRESPGSSRADSAPRPLPEQTPSMGPRDMGPPTDQAALIRAILDDPDDDAPRLAFADWLAANGQPARADWIRASCELARIPYRDARRKQALAWERETFSRCRPAWWEPLTSMDIDQVNDRGVFRFVLGLPGSDPWMAVKRLGRVAWLGQAFDEGWLQRIDLAWEDGRLTKHIAAWPAPAARIPLWACPAPQIQDDGLRRLLALPQLCGLDLLSNVLRNPVARELARYPNLRDLTVQLRLVDQETVDAVLDQITAMPNLRRLELKGHERPDYGTRPNDADLLRLGSLSSLKRLYLTDSPWIGDGAVEAFRRARPSLIVNRLIPEDPLAGIEASVHFLKKNEKEKGR